MIGVHKTVTQKIHQCRKPTASEPYRLQDTAIKKYRGGNVDVAKAKMNVRKNLLRGIT